MWKICTLQNLKKCFEKYFMKKLPWCQSGFYGMMKFTEQLPTNKVSMHINQMKRFYKKSVL